MSWFIDKLTAVRNKIRGDRAPRNIDLSDDSDDDNKAEYIDQDQENKEREKLYGVDEFHIENLRHFQVTNLRTIGSGAFSLVKKCHSNKLAMELAVKIILLDEKKNESYIQKFLPNEIALWKELSVEQHVNVLQLIDTVHVGDFMYILTEVAERGDLHQCLLTGAMSEYKAKAVFKDVADAVRFCHSKQIAHRDIKPQNLLLGDRDRVKLADFSFVTKKNPVGCEYCGTPMMLAPEQVSSGFYNPFKSDVWQLGLTLYAMVTAKVPFDSQKKHQIIREMQQVKCGYKGIPFPRNRILSVECKNLLVHMLDVEHESRYNISQVHGHAWLRGGKRETSS